MIRHTPGLTRRHAIAATAAMPLTAALSGPIRAAAPLQGVGLPAFTRFNVGKLEVTSLLAGSRVGDKPQETFGLNATPEEFAEVSAQAFIPVDRQRQYFNPVLVNTGTELVLFDTGLTPEGITAALAAAGVAPDDIDVVVLTHMHGDHIGGLAGTTGPTFANARYIAGTVEHNHWSAIGNDGFDKLVRPLNEKMTFVDDGDEPIPGLSAIAAFGHTPGHMAWHLESGGARLMLTADTANHYVWSLARPDWEVRFDADKPMAAGTRKRIFGQIAADRIPFLGYHIPAPGLGYVEAQGAGFRYVPASYQLMLEG